jgi:membrane protein required for beta-lactamase induction
MKLIVLLICLAVMRYTTLPKQMMQLWRLIESYFLTANSYVRTQNEWLGVVVLLLPPIALLAFVFYVIAKASMAVYSLLALLAMLFSIGQFTEIETGAGFTQLKNFFVDLHQQVFSVLFWFIALGPVGALAARSISVLQQQADKPDSPLAVYSDHVGFLKSIVDWLPMRLEALVYGLAGDFARCFNHFLVYVGRGVDANEELLGKSGLIALGIPDENEALPQDVVEETAALFRRAMMIVLVFVALFTLGAWLA